MRKSSNDIPFKDLIRVSLPFKWSIISKYFDFDRDAGFLEFFSVLTQTILIGSYWEFHANGLRGLGKRRDVFACGYQPCTIPCRNPLDNQIFAVISTNTDRLALSRYSWICWLLIFCYLFNMLFVCVIRRASGHFVLCVVAYFPWFGHGDLMCKHDTVVQYRWFKF